MRLYSFIIIAYSINLYSQQKPTILDEFNARINLYTQQLEQLRDKLADTAISGKIKELTIQQEQLQKNSQISALTQKIQEQQKGLQKTVVEIYEQNKNEFTQISQQMQAMQEALLPLLKQKLSFEIQLEQAAQPFLNKIKELGNTILSKSTAQLTTLQNSRPARIQLQKAIHQEEAKLYPAIENLNNQLYFYEHELFDQIAQLPEQQQNQYWQQRLTKIRLQVLQELIENPAGIAQLSSKKLLGNL